MTPCQQCTNTLYIIHACGSRFLIQEIAHVLYLLVFHCAVDCKITVNSGNFCQAIQDITRIYDTPPEEIVTLIYDKIDVNGEGKGHSQ